AAEKDNLLKMLRASIAGRDFDAGKPLVTPRCQAPAPKAGPADVLLFLVSRTDHRHSWGEFPSENWIVLKEQQWKSWLPPSSDAGTTYAIPAKEAAIVLTYFFPQTEICDFGKALDADGPYKHRLEKLGLQAKVLGADGNVLKVRLDGTIKLKHNFY